MWFGYAVVVIGLLLSYGASHVESAQSTVGSVIDEYDPLAIARLDNPCEGYDGILHIQGGDEGGATGTLFFMHMVNHLIYAQMHNLLPWAFFTYGSKWCYDARRHGWYDVSILISEKAVIPMINNGVEGIGTWPGAPQYSKHTGLPPMNLTISGSHLWDTYFFPVSDFSPEDNPCRTPLPLVQLLQTPHVYSTTAGMHHFAPYSNRAWPYRFLPHYLTPAGMNLTLDEWYKPQRLRGAALVKKHVHPLPWLEQAVDKVFPTPSLPCLAMHVRESDKGSGRTRIPLERYRPYVEAFVEEGGDKIHLATDSSTALKRIRKLWSPEIADLIVMQPNARRVSGKRAVFHYTWDRHSRNREALIDIYGMSKCSFLLHGASAMTEAVMYVNGNIIGRNVDLDDRDRPSAAEFRQVVARDFRVLEDIEPHSLKPSTLHHTFLHGSSLVLSISSVVFVFLIWKTSSARLRRLPHKNS